MPTRQCSSCRARQPLNVARSSRHSLTQCEGLSVLWGLRRPLHAHRAAECFLGMGTFAVQTGDQASRGSSTLSIAHQWQHAGGNLLPASLGTCPVFTCSTCEVPDPRSTCLAGMTCCAQAMWGCKKTGPFGGISCLRPYGSLAQLTVVACILTVAFPNSLDFPQMQQHFLATAMGIACDPCGPLWRQLRSHPVPQSRRAGVRGAAPRNVDQCCSPVPPGDLQADRGSCAGEPPVPAQGAGP